MARLRLRFPTRWVVYTLIALSVTGLTFFLADVQPSISEQIGQATAQRVLPSGQQPGQSPNLMAQRVRPQDAWQMVYERLPELPLENQYISKETGEIDPNQTLIKRFIQYHVFVKGRPSQYRLDWKLTLADYLGANERMVEGTYPGSDVLRENPMAGDRAAIGALNRAQRDALVDVLVSILNPDANQTPAPTVAPTPSPSPESRPSSPPPLPNQGDADLLRL